MSSLMIINLIVLILIPCIFAQVVPPLYNEASVERTKNFTSLEEALKDSEQYMIRVKDDYNLPSLQFGISIHGKTLYSKSWGFADLETQTKANLSTKYRSASISKSFTAVYFATLLDKGLVELDAPLRKYVPTFPIQYWENKPVELTCRQLLSHTAGTHVTNLEDFKELIIAQNVTHMIHLLANQPLISKPGLSQFLFNFYLASVKNIAN